MPDRPICPRCGRPEATSRDDFRHPRLALLCFRSFCYRDDSAEQDCGAVAVEFPELRDLAVLRPERAAFAAAWREEQAGAALLREWIGTKLASPHRPGHDGHVDGFCLRCANLYADGMRALASNAGRSLAEKTRALVAVAREWLDCCGACNGTGLRVLHGKEIACEDCGDLRAAVEAHPWKESIDG